MAGQAPRLRRAQGGISTPVLVDKGVLSVAEFKAKFEEFDMLDGKLDGR